MKNSKVLSLLTAAALVVSSFSGLAMNGGVARAAAGWLSASAAPGAETEAIYASSAVGYAASGDITLNPGTSSSTVKIKVGSDFVSGQWRLIADKGVGTLPVGGEAYVPNGSVVNVSEVTGDYLKVDAVAPGTVVLCVSKTAGDFGAAALAGVANVIAVRITVAGYTADGAMKLVETASGAQTTYLWTTGSEKNFGLVKSDAESIVLVAGDTLATSTNVSVQYTLTKTGTGLAFKSAPALATITTNSFSPIALTWGGAAGADTLTAVATFTGASGTKYRAEKVITITTVANAATVHLGSVVNTDGVTALDAHTTDYDSEMVWVLDVDTDAQSLVVGALTLAPGNTDATIADLQTANTIDGTFTFTISGPNADYFEFVGQASKTRTVKKTAAAYTVADAVQIGLTDAGKKLSESKVATLTVTADWNVDGGAGGARYAGTRSIELVASAPVAFDAVLIDENNEEYGDEIAWTVDDMKKASKNKKYAAIRSKDGAVINLGSGAIGTSIYSVKFELSDVTGYTRTGLAATHDYTTAAGLVGATNYLPRTDGANTTAASVNDWTLSTTGLTNQKANLKVTVIARRGGNYYRSVINKTMSTVIVGLTTNLEDYYAVGTTIDLDKDLAISYNGTAVDNTKCDFEVSTGDGKTATITNRKLTVGPNVGDFQIHVVYKDDTTNTTAEGWSKSKGVAKLNVTFDSYTFEVGEYFDLKYGLINGKAADALNWPNIIWSIKSGSDFARLSEQHVLFGLKAGEVKARVLQYAADGKTVTGYGEVTLTVTDPSATPEPSPVHTAGEDFVDDETGIACHVEDDLTITVTAAPVVGDAITIPDTIDGLTVASIAPQAFKKSSAKRVYVFAPIDTLGKGAFKNSKVKKAYFYDPAALQTVGKNAFKKTNAKVVGVGAAFDDGVAKDLKKAGAKTVKNNGTAK